MKLKEKTMIINGEYTQADIKAVEYDEGVISQIYYMMQSPAINNHVVIMPDTHVGKGSVVGFTMRYSDMIIPNIVGVDIGCGMLTAKIENPNLELSEVDKLIREVVPVGFDIHEKAFYQAPKELSKKVGIDLDYASRSIGTLGGGNHFIELGTYNGEYYLTIHTGSRNLGLKTAVYHQNKAEAECRQRGSDYNTELAKLKTVYSSRELGEKIAELKRTFDEKKSPKDLAYLSGNDASEYLQDMFICQEYAALNRKTILRNICATLGIMYEVVAESVHNYISKEDQFIRKGAISAQDGERVIIPINRTFGTIIGAGKGNSEWNYSAPHGAGRLMSRGVAKSTFTQEDADNLIGDVYSSYNPIDECDLVYKSPDSIIEAIAPTVEIQYIIKPVLNVKG
jgi:tRNA-splicing ligase RtcB